MQLQKDLECVHDIGVWICTHSEGLLNKVPRSDVLVLLGDFNAQIGVLKCEDEEW